MARIEDVADGHPGREKGFQFRIWSTVDAEECYQRGSQDEALFVFQTHPMCDRIDYRKRGESIWFFVDPEDLQRVCIEDIHRVDRKQRDAKGIIYIVLGASALLVSALMVFA